VKEIQKYDQPEWLPGLKSSDLTLKNRAFQAMMDVWQKQIYSHLLHLLGNHDDADDATQETFIQLLRSIEAFEERSKFSTWLYTIAHRKGIECLRNRSKIKRLFTRNETKLLHDSAAAPAGNLSEVKSESYCKRLCNNYQPDSARSFCCAILKAFSLDKLLRLPVFQMVRLRPAITTHEKKSRTF